MLNLRQLDNKTSTQTIGRFSNFSAPQFRVTESIFGNFGEPLEHGASLLGEGEGEQEQNEVDEGIPTDDTPRAGDAELQLGKNKDGRFGGGEASTSSVGDITEIRRTDEFIV